MKRRQRWLTKIGRFTVEHVPCPRPGQAIDDDAPPKGLLHTIQGSLESGLAVFRQHYAPTFSVGRDRKGKVRILQHVPLGELAAALENHAGGVETNRICRVQIEIAGFSQTTAWSPDAGVCEALAALMHALVSLEGIPLEHVAVKRNAKRWVRASGWVGHIDAPENTHWDPGALMYERLFSLAGEPPKVKTKARPKKVQPATWVLVRASKGAAPAPLCAAAAAAK